MLVDGTADGGLTLIDNGTHIAYGVTQLTVDMIGINYCATSVSDRGAVLVFPGRSILLWWDGILGTSVSWSQVQEYILPSKELGSVRFLKQQIERRIATTYNSVRQIHPGLLLNQIPPISHVHFDLLSTSSSIMLNTISFHHIFHTTRSTPHRFLGIIAARSKQQACSQRFPSYPANNASSIGMHNRSWAPISQSCTSLLSLSAASFLRTFNPYSPIPFQDAVLHFLFSSLLFLLFWLELLAYGTEPFKPSFKTDWMDAQDEFPLGFACLHSFPIQQSQLYHFCSQISVVSSSIHQQDKTKSTTVLHHFISPKCCVSQKPQLLYNQGT